MFETPEAIYKRLLRVCDSLERDIPRFKRIPLFVIDLIRIRPPLDETGFSEEVLDCIHDLWSRLEDIVCRFEGIEESRRGVPSPQTRGRVSPEEIGPLVKEFRACVEKLSDKIPKLGF